MARKKSKRGEHICSVWAVSELRWNTETHRPEASRTSALERTGQVKEERSFEYAAQKKSTFFFQNSTTYTGTIRGGGAFVCMTTTFNAQIKINLFYS